MDLLDLLLAFLTSLQSPPLDSFLTLWPRAATPTPAAAPTPLGFAPPVLGHLAAITANAPPTSIALTQCIRLGAASRLWRQTYRRGELPAEFFDNYAWTELVAANSSSVEQHLTCGALLLGPRTLYPRHRHEAEEIYVPLSGTARWQQGDEVWRVRAPGSVIHHASDEPHAMHTDNEPLLAIYLWRGTGLSRPARLEAAANDSAAHLRHKEFRHD